jgi:hypothetical protein
MLVLVRVAGGVQEGAAEGGDVAYELGQDAGRGPRRLRWVVNAEPHGGGHSGRSWRSASWGRSVESRDEPCRCLPLHPVSPPYRRGSTPSGGRYPHRHVPLSIGPHRRRYQRKLFAVHTGHGPLQHGGGGAGYRLLQARVPYHTAPPSCSGHRYRPYVQYEWSPTGTGVGRVRRISPRHPRGCRALTHVHTSTRAPVERRGPSYRYSTMPLYHASQVCSPTIARSNSMSSASIRG